MANENLEIKFVEKDKESIEDKVTSESKVPFKIGRLVSYIKDKDPTELKDRPYDLSSAGPYVDF